MKLKYYIIIMLLSLLEYTTVFGQCDKSCHCGDAETSPAGTMITHGHEKGEWMFSYSYMNMAMKNNISGSLPVSEQTIFANYLMLPKNMNMDMHMLMAMYGISDNFSAMGMVSYNTSSMSMEMLPGVAHNHNGAVHQSNNNNMIMNSSTQGLGDMKFWLMYNLYKSESSSILLSTGVNVPTGNISIIGPANSMYEAQALPYMMQMGSGSFDIMPGITYILRGSKINWTSQALSTIRPFYNSYGYHYGHDLEINSWAAYRISSALSMSLRVQGYAAGAIQGCDRRISSGMEPACDISNYGGTKVNAYAGINYYINKNYLKNCKIGIEYGLPCYQHLNGIQLATNYILNARITKSF